MLNTILNLLAKAGKWRYASLLAHCETNPSHFEKIVTYINKLEREKK